MDISSSYTDINSAAFDRWVEAGWEWGIPITPAQFARAKSGVCEVLLTPTRYVPASWVPQLCGAKLLGLASGGGQQMPVFAALGAVCTVLDYSDRQLESERMVARREGYDITVIKADMTKRLPFDDAVFDIIFHPVSNCYVEDVRHVWRECCRVLRRGGVLLSGLDNGLNYLFDDPTAVPLVVVNKLPFNPLKDAELMKKLEASDDGVQFSHTLEEQIGGQLEAGFTLTHIYEDSDGTPGLASYAPQYFATRAVKP